MLTTTAGPGQPLRATPGQLLTFDVQATDPENDPVRLTLAGRGFDAAAVGAQLLASPSGTAGPARFSWRVPCPAAGQNLYEFLFTATDAPCGPAATTTVVIPIQVEDRNAPPSWSSALFVAGSAPLVQLIPGNTFETTVEGVDPDRDPLTLTLTATGVGFDLAAAGMAFTTRQEAGRTIGLFRWEASCAAPFPGPVAVTFTLQEASCRPVLQQRTVQFVVVNPEAVTFLPPTIFTPNQDGKNDAFELLSLPPDYCAQRFTSITVFNRWGKQVFTSPDRRFRWDGQGLPAGVYYYVIDYSNQRQFKGHVTLAY
ncbi:gliding motility-associated C-terminal domain-containing protein [Hymenobacter sp. HD11105]